MAIDPTPRSDYDHWNEERDIMWWMEVGRFGGDTEPDFDPYDDDLEEDD